MNIKIENFKSDFIEKCVAARKIKKVTLQNVADELGYTKGNISAFEKGKNNSLLIAIYYIIKFDVEV